MDLRRNVPWPITWALRLVLWPIALLIVAVAFVFTSSLALGLEYEGCSHQADRAVKPPGGPGFGLRYTQAMAACLDDKANILAKYALHFQKGVVQSPRPVLCYYVGRWKSTRPNLVYDITLKPDRTFVARPMGSPEPPTTGTWLNENRRLTWLYDNGLIWPPDRNRVIDASVDGFTLVEQNGSLTRYDLLERIDAPGCVDSFQG